MANNIVATTAERLRYAISYRHTTAAEVSNKTGISRGSLSQYISGKFNPKQDRLYVLAKHLRVSPLWLMGIDVPMEKAKPAQNANPIPESLVKDVQTLEAYKELYNDTSDIGKAFRDFASAMVKHFQSEEADKIMIKKFHALSAEHQTMVVGMINGFYHEDMEKQRQQNAPTTTANSDEGELQGEM